MEMSVITLVLILVANLSFASQKSEILDIRYNHKINLNLIRKDIKLEDLRIKGKELSAKEISNLRERHSAGGGDDVGNGGDELRQEFLRIGLEIIEEGALAYLYPALDIDKIVVVNELKIIRFGDETRLKSIVIEGIIFLDAKSWDPHDGLLSKNHDPRYQMIQMMTDALNIKLSESDKLKAWHSLEARKSTIWCPAEISNHKVEIIFKEFRAEGLSSGEAEAYALTKCREEGLQNCRIKESIVRGFMSWSKNHAVAIGQKNSEVPKTSQEIKQDQCKALRACEQIYEWAPQGQIKPSDFGLIEKEATKICR
jgi:hypothetical protein